MALVATLAGSLTTSLLAKVVAFSPHRPGETWDRVGGAG
jgi:hypothetical protein